MDPLKFSRRWFFQVGAAAMLVLGVTAAANADVIVSPVVAWPVKNNLWLLVWATAVGVIEAPLVWTITRSSWGRCAGFSLMANFLSGLVGWSWPIDAIQGSLWDSWKYGGPAAPAEFATLLLMCWVFSLLVETPFLYMSCERKPGRVRLAVSASVAAQSASYAILAPIAWWLGS